MRAQRASLDFREALLMEHKDALPRGFNGGSLRSHSLSTTPLASYLGSPPLLSQEGKLGNADPAEVSADETKLI